MPDVDRISRAARLLAVGRAPGVVVAFAIPLVLARMFDQAEFGTYKQLFLIYATLFGLAQLGMAESLYYFVPREPAKAGRHVANAIVALAAIGLACVAVLYHGRDADRRLAEQPGARAAPRAARLVPGADADLGGARDRAGLAQAAPRRPRGPMRVSDIARAACFVIPAAAGLGTARRAAWRGRLRR